MVVATLLTMMELLLNILFIVIILRKIKTVYKQLSEIPGPFFAKFSNFPRLYWVWTKHAHEKHIALHRKYGKLVRIGPDVISVGDPAEIPHIYGFNETFVKSDFYSVILPYVNGKSMPGLLSAKDANLHRALKRPIANLYSLSNLVSFENFVDDSIRKFFNQLDQLFIKTPNKPCDLGFWLPAFVFDTLGEITFSKPYGFVEQAKDVESIMGDIWKHFSRVSLVGQMPWIDTFLRINPLLSKLRPKPMSPIVKFAMARMQERKNRGITEEDSVNNQDLLSRFLVAQAKNPLAPPFAIMTWITGNITAGSDTTATILSAIFYYLLKYPDTLQKLKEEIVSATKTGRISQPPTWQESQTLKYLDAVVLEAQRIHPPVGMHLERVVPSEGANICGKYLPGGSVVGINAWVVHHDKEVFGEDVDEWRPERWIDCTEEQRFKMEKALFTFGAGTRVCIGKNFSLLIIYKLVPSLLQEFDLSLFNPKSEWVVENRWFIIQKDFFVTLKKTTL